MRAVERRTARSPAARRVVVHRQSARPACSFDACACDVIRRVLASPVHRLMPTAPHSSAAAAPDPCGAENFISRRPPPAGDGAIWLPDQPLSGRTVRHDTDRLRSRRRPWRRSRRRRSAGVDRRCPRLFDRRVRRRAVASSRSSGHDDPSTAAASRPASASARHRFGCHRQGATRAPGNAVRPMPTIAHAIRDLTRSPRCGDTSIVAVRCHKPAPGVQAREPMSQTSPRRTSPPRGRAARSSVSAGREQGEGAPADHRRGPQPLLRAGVRRHDGRRDRAAPVSRRTFFRYFESKARALLRP